MFETLLESKSKSERVTGGAVASIGAHAAIIAAAVLATAQAGLRAPIPQEVVHPVYFPPGPIIPTTEASVDRKKGTEWRLPTPINVRRIDVNLPPIDISSTPMTPVDFPSSPNRGLAGQDGKNSESNPTVPFQPDQVEKQAALIPGSATARYPDALRSLGVEGEAIALFVVDVTGRAETDSVRFLRSDNRLFEDAVRAVLPRMRFVPAEIGGRKVRQLVQMPFVFTIER